MGTAFDFFRNVLGDAFGDNLIVNGEAEPGQLTGWTAIGGADTVIGGVSIYGDFVFKLPAGGSQLLQTITVPHDSDMVQVFGFFYSIPQLIQEPGIGVYLEIVLSYVEDGVLFDIYKLFPSAALTEEFAGVFYDPARNDVNYFLALGTIPSRANKTLLDITVVIRNDSDHTVYCDNIGVRLNIGIEATRSAHSGQPMVDKYGIDNRFVKYGENLVHNASFELFPTESTQPSFWVGGVVDANTHFAGSYSALIVAAGEMIQHADAAIDPSTYGNKLTRVSFQHRGADFKVQVYDVTNADYFTLTAEPGTLAAKANPLNGANYITFTANIDWVDSRNSLSFDPTEFGSCTALKIKFTNMSLVSGNIDDVALVPDFTGKWAPVYTPGPKTEVAYVPDKRHIERLQFWTGTEAQYAAIAVKDDRILYFCTEA